VGARLALAGRMPTIPPRIVRAEARDRSTVLALLAEHTPGADVAHRHAWLYESNPHGAAVTFLAFDAGGTPMGLTSLFPRRVVVKGEVRMGAIGGDGYVRPAFRRRGVATALHRACLALMEESLLRGSGVEFMYGGPEPTNLVALERAGSRTITRLRRYSRSGPLQALFRLGGAMRGRSRTRLAPLEGADARVGEVFVGAAAGAAILPVRDPEQYAWRFRTPSRAQHPFAVMEGDTVTAICALERKGTQVAVIDFLAPREGWSATLRSAANAAGGDTLTTITTDGSPSAVDLLYAGFVPREGKGFQVLAPIDHPALPTLLNPASWQYVWADGDLDHVL
jgi:GNAT superfamily N-acetyltransferase